VWYGQNSPGLCIERAGELFCVRSRTKTKPRRGPIGEDGLSGVRRSLKGAERGPIKQRRDTTANFKPFTISVIPLLRDLHDLASASVTAIVIASNRAYPEGSTS
jgi:hypothetical protein